MSAVPAVISEPSSDGSMAIELLALFGLVLGDSLGVPVPGDSALLVAGGLAADGRFPLWAVVVVATAAAIIGDAIAYEAGRHGGRRILARDGRFAERRRALLSRAERFYARYGLVAVFLLKFVPGVRAVSAVTAGTSHMPRRSFAIVNALACLTWTTLTASIAYAAGPTGALVLALAGLTIACIALVVGAVARRRRTARPGPATTP